MNEMKKILSAILSVLMIISLVPATAFAAAADAVITIVAGEAYAGKTVEVSISIDTEKEWSSLGFILDYDEDILVYDRVSYGEVAEKNLFGKENVYDPSTSYVAVGFASAQATSGEIITLTFTVDEDAEEGDVYVSATEINFEYDTLTAEASSDAVSVKRYNFTGLTLKGATYTYDGSEKEILVTGTLPEGAEVDYEDNKGTDAGTYKAKAIVTKKGYNTLNLSADLVIKPAMLEIKDMSVKDKTYDKTADAEIVEGTLTGIIGDDDVEAVYPENGTFAQVDVKSTAIAVSLDEITLTGEDAGNYTLKQPTGLKAKITKAPITVTADSFELTVGDEIPDLTYKITEGELFGSDDFEGELSTRATTEEEGTFDITKGTFKTTANYDLTFIPGTITVLEKPVQEITVADFEDVTYGDEGFKLNVEEGSKVTASEIVFASSNENVATIDAEGNVTIKNAGETEISVTKAGDDTYAAFNWKKTLKVNKVEITVNAESGQGKRIGNDDPELLYTYEGELVGDDAFTGVLTRKSGETIGFYDILIGTLTLGDNYNITFNSAKFEIADKVAQDITVETIGTKTYGDEPFAIEVTEGLVVSGEDIVYESSNENVAVIEDGVITIKGTGYTYITVSKRGDGTHKDFSDKQKLTVAKGNITVDVVEGQYKRIGTEDPVFEYEYEGKLAEGDEFTGALTRRSGEKVGLYDILIGTLKLNSNYKITFNSAKFEIIDKLRQDVTVDELAEVTYGDEAFKLGVEKGDEVTDSEIIFASSNEDVATIDAEGNITIKNAGVTEISVTKAGNEDYADFSLTQTLKVNKAEIKIIVTPGQSKKVGSDDPVIAYTYEGTLATGDEITGALARKEGEAIGTYPVYIGTLDITNGINYDVKFVSATFEITEKTAQTITLTEIPALTYGDAPYAVTVTKDETANLEAYIYESDNEDVLTIADGVITIKAAGEATIKVTEPGNDEYASGIATQKVTVNKKAILVDSIDLAAKTAVIVGILDSDEVALDFNKLQLEMVEDIDESTSVVLAKNFVLTGEKAVNYIFASEAIETTVAKNNIATVAVTADKGEIEGDGTYLLGAEVTLKAIAPKNYKFAGWYLDGVKLSGDTVITIALTEDKNLTAKFTKKSTGGGGGGGTSYCTVKFDTDGGSTVTSFKVEHGAVLGDVTAPTKEGYEFGGWFLDKEFTTEVTAESKIKGNITLYARWVEKAKKEIVLTIGEKDATVFGEGKANDVAPIIRNDRTMLPARFVAEALGATVTWNEETRKVTITKDELVIIITIDSDKATVNGEEVTLDSPAFIENDRTYTPVRFVAEALGANVAWEEETQKVTITVK